MNAEDLEAPIENLVRSVRPFGMRFLERLPVVAGGEGTGTETPPPIELTGTPGNDIDHETGSPDSDQD
jgi:hypothetical protein